MSSVELVFAGNQRAALQGLVLPDPPPTRIYISGREYKIAAPRAVLPPLINTIKLIVNWVGPAGRVAKNILYALKGAGTGSTSDPAFLKAVAESLMSKYAATGLSGQLSPLWTFQSVTARDNGGTSSVATSTLSSIVGTSPGQTNPPQCAVCLSWIIPESYRGGKPRSYIPGIPTAAMSTNGDSTLSAAWAVPVDNFATTWLATFNAALVMGTGVTLGTVSHYTGHAVRPTPVWRTFIDVRVHERLDSQRRRSGKESTFATTP